MRVYLVKARKQGKEIKDPTSKWSWFEEFYKKCTGQNVETLTDVLNNAPMAEIEALRAGDEVKGKKMSQLLEAVKRVMSEGKLKV
jgi:hypothetical protein